MIIEEQGTEEDLVLLVMSMIEIENQQSSNNPLSFNDFSSLFFNSAYAQNAELTAAEVGYCAAVALGADALWALGGSSASAWSISAIKRAFGAVAKRFLGPIGVAIAVVSFGICIYDASLD